MNTCAQRDRLWIIGAGRVGLALGLLLSRSGSVGELAFSGRSARPPDHPLFAGSLPPARYTAVLEPPRHPTGVLLAVPDDALFALAGRLAKLGLAANTPVLHLSGVRGAEVLDCLSAAGLSVGALHPLAAVADPIESVERLRGSWWGVEAGGAALRLAERIVDAAGGRILHVPPGGKALYHAAAVFASNYVVGLLGVAVELMKQAGVDPDTAGAALTFLAAGAVADVERTGPADALTGPVARGDEQTVRLHLAQLSEPERTIYSSLARAVLGLARQRGLHREAAERIERLLEEER